MSPAPPKLKIARKYMNAAHIGMMIAIAKVSSFANSARPTPMTARRITASTAMDASTASNPQRCRCRNSEAKAAAAECMASGTPGMRDEDLVERRDAVGDDV